MNGAVIELLHRTIRTSTRSLLRNPGVSVPVVICFALGIGVNTAVFSIVDALILRPPAAVEDPSHVVRVYITHHYPGRSPTTLSTASFPDYVESAEDVRAFSSLSSYWNARVGLGRGTQARQVNASLVTQSYFPLLGLKAKIGRFFSVDEDQVGSGALVAVLSYRIWARGFGADSDVVGRTIQLGRDLYTIIGVAPEGFDGLDLIPVDIWIPIRASASRLFTSDALTNRGNSWISIIGRLRNGISPPRAETEINTAYRYHALSRNSADSVALVALGPLQRNQGPLKSQASRVAVWLQLTSALVLVICTVNAVGLLVARGVRRKKELGIRIALGAERKYLALECLVESLIVCVSGGAAALVLGGWVGHELQIFLVPETHLTASLFTTRTTGVGVGIMLGVSLATGLVLTLQASAVAPAPSLRGDKEKGALSLWSIRGRFLIVQIALTLVLMVEATLLVRSLTSIRALDLGMAIDRVLLVSADLPRAGFKPREVESTFQLLSDRLRSLPGVEHTAVTASIPFRSFQTTSVIVPGLDSIPAEMGSGPSVNVVSSDYFATTGTRILVGRGFQLSDLPSGPRVAVVNERLARLLWPAGDALGRCIKVGSDTTPCAEIVGISQDARSVFLLGDPSPQLFLLLGQYRGSYSLSGLLARISPPSTPATLVSTVRRALSAASPSLPYLEVEPLPNLLASQVRPWRLAAILFEFFGILALVLSAVGVYSMLSYQVTSRTREIGVRIALGATRKDVVRLVVIQGVVLAGVGVVGGAIGAIFAGKALTSLFYGVSPTDPVTIGAAAVFLLGVVILACVFPANRAANTSPLSALRAE